MSQLHCDLHMGITAGRPPVKLTLSSYAPDLDSSALQLLEQFFLLHTSIGKEVIHFTHRAQCTHGLFAELGVIGKEDDLSSLFDHDAFAAEDGFFVVRGSFGINARGGEESPLGAVLAEEGLGLRTDDKACFRLEEAAAEIDFRTALGAFQTVDGLGDDEGVREDADAFVRDKFSELEGGGAAIDHHDVAILQESGGGAGDGAFGFGIVTEAFREGRRAHLQGAATGEADAAPRTLHLASLFQFYERAPDGGRGCAQTLARVRERKLRIALQEREDLFEALFAFHGSVDWLKALKRFTF